MGTINKSLARVDVRVDEQLKFLLKRVDELTKLYNENKFPVGGDPKMVALNELAGRVAGARNAHKDMVSLLVARTDKIAKQAGV